MVYEKSKCKWDEQIPSGKDHIQPVNLLFYFSFDCLHYWQDCNGPSKDMAYGPIIVQCVWTSILPILHTSLSIPERYPMIVTLVTGPRVCDWSFQIQDSSAELLGVIARTSSRIRRNSPQRLPVLPWIQRQARRLLLSGRSNQSRDVQQRQHIGVVIICSS